MAVVGLTFFSKYLIQLFGPQKFTLIILNLQHWKLNRVLFVQLLIKSSVKPKGSNKPKPIAESTAS